VAASLDLVTAKEREERANWRPWKFRTPELISHPDRAGIAPTIQSPNFVRWLCPRYRVSRKSPVPSQFERPVDMTEQILFYSLIHSVSQSGLTTRFLIEIEEK
jgi:hypothetical protein